MQELTEDQKIKQEILKNTDLVQGFYEQGFRKGVSNTLENKHGEIQLYKEMIYKKDMEIFHLKNLLDNQTIVTITTTWLKKLSRRIMTLIQGLRRSIG